MTIIEKYDSMEYGPAPENQSAAIAWLDSHERKFKHFIDGAWAQPQSKTWFGSKNPATGELLAEVAQGSARDVDAAVAAATAASGPWQKLGGHGRARHLYALTRAIQKHARMLAVLESLDNGKSIRESRDIDVPLVARHFYHHVGWAQLADTKLKDFAPLGVVGQVIPWNFPLLMMAWKIAPALAAGNTVVLKPAEYTSLTALRFAELCMEAGLPKGVINIVTGDGETGAEIVGHDGFQKLAFTGSTDVGRIIRRASAGTGKKLTLELGGKSPFIVFDDADLDSAVEGLVDAIWFNQGQVCCAGSRLIAQEGIADRLYAKLRRRMNTLRLGDPLDKGIDIGAIVDPSQRDQIDALVQAGVKDGATLFQPDIDMPSEGCFYPPTLLTDVESSNICAREEIFGPVLSATTFRTLKEGVELANNTRYGLAASIWTESLNKAMEVAPQVRAGVIWVNSTNLFDAAAGFGGFRESGVGREGGIEGMMEYLKPKFEKNLQQVEPQDHPETHFQTAGGDLPNLDRTAKLYIGGKQSRSDNDSSLTVASHDGVYAGAIAHGQYKDIRNAVEAAAKATAWRNATAHNKAQILYYLAENLSIREGEFVKRLTQLTGAKPGAAKREVNTAIERLFNAAAWADKYDGQIHTPPMRGIVAAMKEPVGTLGILCPDNAPLLGFISLLAPAIAMGNTAVIVPSERYPLLATDFYQILNIVTGPHADLAPILAKHDNVDGIWYHGSAPLSQEIEALSAENIKRTWVNHGRAYDWFDIEQGAGEHLLRQATEVKNIWLPYGDQI
jgi:aldehyde dehydrogenase (NAD+)